MTTERRSYSWLQLTAIATAGVVLAHWLTYQVAVPGHIRAHVLAQTGHGYWLLAVKVAVVLGVAAAGAATIRGMWQTSSPRRRAESLAWMALRLATLQVVAFVALEVAERLVGGTSLATLFHDHILVVGVAFQVLVAGPGAVSLILAARAGSGLACLMGVQRPAHRRAVSSLRPALAVRVSAVPLGAFGVRGPPPGRA